MATRASCGFHRTPQPWAIVPVAILFGGLVLQGSLLQRRPGLPDASVLVLQGMAFVLILASEALRSIDTKRWFSWLRGLGPAPAILVAKEESK